MSPLFALLRLGSSCRWSTTNSQLAAKKLTYEKPGHTLDRWTPSPG
jgi:hypothetical protein